MSGHGFHVHGPHDHELEHAAAHGDRDLFSGRIAVATALLATVGAMFAYMAGAVQNDAGTSKNNAAIKKTEAANQWSYYQAKSSKQNLAELGVLLVAEDRRGALRADIQRYEAEKAQIKAAAEALEAESLQWDRKSDEQTHQHHRWAQATTALQIAIAMAAICLLTRRRWLQVAMYGVAALGIGLGAAAALHL